MRVLLVHNRYRQPGGEDEVFQREGDLLRSGGHKLIEYTIHNDDITVNGTLSKARIAMRTLWAWDSIAELRSILRHERPDLVHFHNTFPLISPGAYYACQNEGVPVVQSLHNARIICPAATFHREGRACEDCLGRAVPWPSIVHACYHNSHLQTAAVAGMLTGHQILGTWRRQVDAYIVFTEFSRHKFINAGLPREKIFVKPHFLIKDPQIKNTAGEYALFVGRLAPEKGVGTLLRAWALLGNSVPLRIVGDGPIRANLEAERDRSNLSNVRFEGWLGRERLVSTMKGAAFVVFPSESYEPFGLTMVEAFACGVPVIASKLDSIAEIVEEEKTGLYFRPGDAPELAARVDWAWSHLREMEMMGRAARLEYEAKYTQVRNYPLLMEIYDRVLHTRNREAA